MRAWGAFFKGEEDKSKLQTIADVTKPPRKRLSAVLAVLKTFEKPRESAFSDKERDFFQAHTIAVCEAALGTLRSIDPARARGRSVIWEDVQASLVVLVSLTRYGFVPCPEDILETAKVCLYEQNYWEVRELGFKLLLNLISSCSDLPAAQHVMLAAIDLSAFSTSMPSSQAPIFPDRSVLTTPPTHNWILLLQDWMKKQRARSQLPDLSIFRKFTQVAIDQRIKECMLLLNKVLDYSKDEEFESTTEGRQAHFQKWYHMLRRSLLFLLYPSLCRPGECVREEMGVQECHPFLQLLVILWLKGCIEEESLRDKLVATEEDYTFVMSILGRAFEFEESSSKIYLYNAKTVTKIYEIWLKRQSLPKFALINFNSHVKLMFDHIVNLYALKKDVRGGKIQLIKRVDAILAHFRANCAEEILPVLVQGSLAIAAKLLECVSNQMISLEVVDLTAKNILETLRVAYNRIDIPWQEFKAILHIWADNSEFIVATWRDLLLELTSVQRQCFEEPYLSFLYLLGNPLLLKEDSQLGWVKSWREALIVLLKPTHPTPAPNLLLKQFMPMLARVARESPYEKCACEALETLMDLLTLTRVSEPPMEFYLLHLARLMYTSLPRLVSTVLKRGDIILTYPGMHILAPTFLKYAVSNPTEGIKVALACICLANHYQSCELLSLESDVTIYAQLKPLVHSVLVAACDDPIVGPQALYGITVCVMDEVMFNSGLADQLVKDTLIPSIGKADANAHSALQCLNFLAVIQPHLAGTVLSTMVSILQDIALRKDTLKESLVLEMLTSLIYWCMYSDTLADDPRLCSSLFQMLISLQACPWRTDLIPLTIEALASQLCFYYQNFPLKGQTSAITQSVISDAEFAGESSSLLHFALGSSTIITLALGSEPGKIIVRNQFGRFCWSMTPFRVIPSGPESDDQGLLEKLQQQVLSYTLNFELETKPTPLESHQFLPDLLNYVKETYPETRPLDGGKAQDLQTELRLMHDFEEFEANYRGISHEPKSTSASFCATRAFLGQLGLLQKMTLLESGTNLDRALGILDKAKFREPVKIGVVYVANGQTNEKEVLANDYGSPAFHEFVQSLGQVVTADKHEGYLGGLDAAGSNGKLVVTWSDWKYDVAFHVVPMMPTDYRDDQQINKKRHVGNDYVHIVWSEHSRDYRADTISSNFNCVHIVVYPLPSQLFRIQILKKLPPEATFGPVQDEMVLSKQLLGPLLRATAINASDAARNTRREAIEPPLRTRRKKLEENVLRYPDTSVTSESVLAALF